MSSLYRLSDEINGHLNSVILLPEAEQVLNRIQSKVGKEG